MKTTKVTVTPEEYKPVAFKIVSFCMTLVPPEPSDKQMMILFAGISTALYSIQEGMRKMGLNVGDAGFDPGSEPAEKK